ncbi:MAG: hypothetical protein P8Z79_03385 [Sedimentisphaerales bacterium]
MILKNKANPSKRLAGQVRHDDSRTGIREERNGQVLTVFSMTFVLSGAQNFQKIRKNVKFFTNCCAKIQEICVHSRRFAPGTARPRGSLKKQSQFVSYRGERRDRGERQRVQNKPNAGLRSEAPNSEF